jgi:peptidoglycan/LPS O-acetylase OafA/YrhL
MSQTLGQSLSGPDARGNAFDSIRLLAASAVIMSHSFALTTGSDLTEPLFRLTQGQATIGLSAVGIFFIVSGVLISMSFDRSKTAARFALNRALRLFPGLWVCILLTVFVLGPMLTVLSLTDYLATEQTWGFLGALIFWPFSSGMGGMFSDHPYPHAVNGSLWTLKYEVACYIGGAVLLLTGRWRRALVLLAWGVSLIGTLLLRDPHQQSGLLYHLAQLLWLFRFYGAGMLCYLYRDRIFLHSSYGWLAALGVVLAMATPVFTEALAIGGAYSLLVLAYRAPRWFKRLTRKGDLSYGVYIYAFPIQQALVPFSLSFKWPALANMALSLPLVLLLAWLSWRYVEAPALRLKPISKVTQDRARPVSRDEP